MWLLIYFINNRFLGHHTTFARDNHFFVCISDSWPIGYHSRLHLDQNVVELSLTDAFVIQAIFSDKQALKFLIN